MDEEVHMARRVFISFRFSDGENIKQSFVSYLMERRKLLIVQKMKMIRNVRRNNTKIFVF